jgi:hypothetical protein
VAAVKVGLLAAGALPTLSVKEGVETVKPAGNPVTATWTFPANPFWLVACTLTDEVAPSATRLTDPGDTASAKSADGAVAAFTESVACVLAVWPLTVVLKTTVAVDVAAEDAAVSVSGNVTPGASDRVVGDTVTPVGRPDTVTVAVPVPAGAASSREVCWPAAPAVNWMLEEESVNESAISLLLLLPLLLPHETRPPANKPLPRNQTTPLKNRLSGWAERNMGAPGGCSALMPAESARRPIWYCTEKALQISHWTAV